MIAPAVWRRAVHLTRRRIEATVPLTLNEITAAKDKVRAEFAMATRRLEMRLADIQARNAEQMVEVARSREELKRMSAERDGQNETIARLEAESAELRSRLEERGEELRRSASRLAEANHALEARAAENRKLNDLYEEATYAASARQIELVGRESDVEKLAEDVSRMKAEQRELERGLAEAVGEGKAAAQSLVAEKQRAAELERKIERLLATVADRDEKIERQARELARAGDAAASAASDESEETEDASGRRPRLEARLATLMRENKRLRSRLTASGQTESAASTGEAGATLREQIIDLAAQVVNMTILLEGEDSAAARAVAQAGKEPAAANGGMSLADRVRALREAAEAQ